MGENEKATYSRSEMRGQIESLLEYNDESLARNPGLIRRVLNSAWVHLSNGAKVKDNTERTLRRRFEKEYGSAPFRVDYYIGGGNRAVYALRLRGFAHIELEEKDFQDETPEGNPLGLSESRWSDVRLECCGDFGRFEVYRGTYRYISHDPVAADFFVKDNGTGHVYTVVREKGYSLTRYLRIVESLVGTEAERLYVDVLQEKRMALGKAIKEG